MDDHAGLPEPLAKAVLALVLLGVVALALLRGKRSWSDKDEALTRRRARTVYSCFLVCGLFALVFVGVAGFAPEHVELLGLLVAPPVAIVGLLGLFNALMTWRVRRVRTLLLLTCVVVVSFVASFLALALAPSSWVPALNIFGAVMFVVCGLCAIGISLRGLGETATPVV